MLQILSRLKPAGKKKKEEEEKRKKQLPKLEEFLTNRDYTGAITLLEVRARTTASRFAVQTKPFRYSSCRSPTL